MHKKSFFALFLVLVSLTALLCGCVAEQPDTTVNTQPDTTADTRPDTAETHLDSTTDAQLQKTITVIVVHADKSEKRFSYTTAESYLDKVLLAQGLIPAGNIVDGMFTVVDGEEASWQKDKAYWALYIDEQYALVGICDAKVEDGAVYKLIYTK